MKTGLIKAGRAALLLVLALLSAAPAAQAGYFPMYSSWEQPGGPGSAITLTYSYGNLLDGSLKVGTTDQPLSASLMRSAFEAAFSDYAAVLPIHFVEVADNGPPPETGEYAPTGMADIRINQVANIDNANAYAYFPQAGSGLAGDIVFNAQRFGQGWSPVFFYAVAQHELGHSLGMGHYLNTVATGSVPGAGADYQGPIIPLGGEAISALQAVYGAGIGSVTPLAAVPEPEAYAMLLAGTALVGFAARRGRSRRGAWRD